MHKLTKIAPLIREEIWTKYSKRMRVTKGKGKEKYYKELGLYYRVHYNTIRKIIHRARRGDFLPHKSTLRANLGYQFRLHTSHDRGLIKRIDRDKFFREIGEKLAISHISLYFPHRTHIHPTEFFACEGSFSCSGMKNFPIFPSIFCSRSSPPCHGADGQEILREKG